MTYFYNKYTLSQRLNDSNTVMITHHDKIPIICEKYHLDTSCPDIDKHKYLVFKNITFGQFISIIRKRIDLPPHDAIFLFVGDNHVIPSNNETIINIYNQHRNHDGFLYVLYSRQTTFG
jgi:GABA(A) receptor-associated protein